MKNSTRILKAGLENIADHGEKYTPPNYANAKAHLRLAAMVARSALGRAELAEREEAKAPPPAPV